MTEVVTVKANRKLALRLAVVQFGVHLSSPSYRLGCNSSRDTEYRSNSLSADAP